MKRVSLVRTETGDDGTFGKLVAPGSFECYTAELPWRDMDGDGKRDRGVSCFKNGLYVCRFTTSPSRKNPDGTPEASYELQAVPDAAGVRIHSGNFVGDIAKGYLSDSEACILLGRAIIEEMEIPAKRQAKIVHASACHHGKPEHVDNGGTLRCRCICTCPRPRTKQKGVSSSRDTVTAFVAHMAAGQFELDVTWAAGLKEAA